MLGTVSTLIAPPLLAVADPLIQPLVIILLCIAAGIGTLWLLPGRRAMPALGGTLLALSLILFGLVVVRATSGKDVSGTGPYFWIFSAIAIAGAIRVITHPRPVYSALYFVLTVFATSGLFILMYAEFMAAALILIYAGAILITYVFVIMLAASSRAGESSSLYGIGEYDIISREPFTAACVGFALMGVLLFVIFDKGQAIPNAAVLAPVTGMTDQESVHGSTQSIGNYLFVDQVVNLEVAGLILTLSMVGAIIIARRRVVGSEDIGDTEPERITATLTPIDDDPRSIPVYGTTNPEQKAFPET
jgi:NADH-quinone oxidoreductase subunit J